jgi:hypothetical protein
LETFKSSVRYVVLMFVMAGAVISLVGLGTDLGGSESVSVDKQESPDKEYAQPKQDLLSAEAGSTG